MGMDYEHYHNNFSEYIKDFIKTVCFEKNILQNIIGKRLAWNKVVDIAKHSKNERILDIGCGWGGISLKLAVKGADIFAIDYSHEATKIVYSLSQ